MPLRNNQLCDRAHGTAKGPYSLLQMAVSRSGAEMHIWYIPGKSVNLFDRSGLWDSGRDGVNELTSGGEQMEGQNGEHHRDGGGEQPGGVGERAPAAGIL